LRRLAVWSARRKIFPPDLTYSDSDTSLVKLSCKPPVTRELASMTVVSRAVLKGEEVMERSSSSLIVKVLVADKVRGKEEAKKAQAGHKISVGPIGNKTSYVNNLLTNLGIKATTMTD
jgi:hypothetical protein